MVISVNLPELRIYYLPKSGSIQFDPRDAQTGIKIEIHISRE